MEKQEIQHLISEEFDVEFHPVYLKQFLTNLGLSRAIPRTKRPSRPENAERFSTNESVTRSTKMTTNPTTNEKETMRTAGVPQTAAAVGNLTETNRSEPLSGEQRFVITTLFVAIALWIVGSFVGVPTIKDVSYIQLQK